MSDPIPEEEVAQVIDDSEIEVVKMGRKTTVMHATLPSGFELVVYSACVDPEDYSEDIGKGICMNKLKKQVWQHLAFNRHED